MGCGYATIDMMIERFALLLAACAALPTVADASSTLIRSEPLHLRSGDHREWRSFPEHATGASTLTFNHSGNARDYSLLLRQRDVKASWSLKLNDRELGSLIQDERDMLLVLPIPAGTLKSGPNTVQITGQPGRFPDDIELRDLRIEDLSPHELQQQARVNIAVTGESGPLPVRITVVDDKGSLVPFAGLRTDVPQAFRTGVIYTPDGKTAIGLPAGSYRILASRGFEYSAPSQKLQLTNGQTAAIRLAIRREVALNGYISCDTHIHTLALSGHGDATVDERVLTAAGEGLDLMITTEHNRVSDYSEAIRKLGLDRWVRSIPGSEVTTATGHFNVFPTAANAPYPNVRETNWSTLMNSIRQTQDVRVVIQNHPRDLHSGYRPFDPGHYLASVGEDLGGRPFRANAMEVVNSGAMASDPLQLVRDWMGLLTRGTAVAAIGASDTHTVDFVPVGQARTYIDVAPINDWRQDPQGVATQLAAGKNLVSYGLTAELRQAGALQRQSVPMRVTVLGPSWATADRIVVFSNGTPVWERKLNSQRPGVKFSETVTIPLPRNDTSLIAVATGPAVLQPFWEVRKPYQPTSDQWNPMILGVSQAIWIDTDGNGRTEAPRVLATRLLKEHGANMDKLTAALERFDSAVAMHALDLLRIDGTDISSTSVQQKFTQSGEQMRAAYQQYTSEIRTADKKQ